MALTWNDRGLLCGRGFTWTYSVFEKYLPGCITPSMYHAMATYVLDEIMNDELDKVEKGEYSPGDLESQAIDAYFDIPLRERIEMHEQELVNLRAAKRLADAKVSSAIDAMLEENRPFDQTSPINHEYSEFMRSLISKYQHQADDLEFMIYEEEQWRGGHEYGAEFDLYPRYDPSDE